ncbi:hypothetical protein BCV71DRAFT_273154 [Rhizopus microsporus]|uniref:Uncharacterized protein n=1 Tax=Rhizopus microsporus TaxID=58291 RepID=A0A1X0RUW8_RHIZD|nr:hypothetical protein BCV71DRAFT_273154 [Rhizopus microsporus]
MEITLLEQPHASPPVLRHCQQIHATASVKRAEKEMEHHVTDVELNKKSRKAAQVEPSQTIPAAYISQLSRLRPLDLGRMDKECSHCHALHWIDERQEISSLRSPSWESCCKRGSVQLQFLPDPPQTRRTCLQRWIKRLSDPWLTLPPSRPLDSSEGSEPSYAQLYIFDPCYAAERRQARNSNLDPEIVRELSAMLSQCNPFVRVYRYAHEILSNHKTDSNSDQTETNTPYIIISPSMRMRLIEGGERRIQNLPTMGEVAAVIPTKYSDRSFHDIILTLRGNNSLCQNIEFEHHSQHISQMHAAYVCTNCILSFPQGTFGRH